VAKWHCFLTQMAHEAEVLAGALRKVLAASAAGGDRNPLVGLRDRSER
jgi:hypothetical protein